MGAELEQARKDAAAATKKNDALTRELQNLHEHAWEDHVDDAERSSRRVSMVAYLPIPTYLPIVLSSWDDHISFLETH